MRGEDAIKDESAAFKFKDIRSAFTLKYNGKLPQWQWRSQDVFIGVAREGPATSLGWHRNIHYFNIKM